MNPMNPPTSTQLRAMTEAEIPAACALWAKAEGVELAEGDSAGEIASYLRRNPGLSTVAFDRGQLVGAVLAGHDGRRGYVYHLAVSPECRGRGIGGAMMQRSLAGLKAAGVVRVLLLVAADNDGGMTFWTKQGWEPLPLARPMGIDL